MFRQIQEVGMIRKVPVGNMQELRLDRRQQGNPEQVSMISKVCDF